MMIVNAQRTLSVRGLGKNVGPRRLWSDLCFTLAPGDILALRGSSGSGKSTLLNAIGLLTTVDEGTITYGDIALSATSRSTRRVRADIVSFLFQDYGLVEDATVTDNLDIAARRRIFGRSRDYSTILERYGLGGREQERVHHLSGGEQQRLALARLHVRPTPIVLADEPTAALDDDNTRTVLDALREFAAQGRIVLIATHSDTVARIAATTLELHHNSHRLTRELPAEKPKRPVTDGEA